jgi:hypothetical protein
LESKFIIPILAFLSITAVLGIFLYLYLHQKQNKLIPKDSYDEARNEFHVRKNHLPYTITTSSINSRLLAFYGTFVGFVTLFLLYVAISNGASIWVIIGIVCLSPVASPFFLLIFPTGLDIFIVPNSNGGIIGYILYFVICLFAVFVQGRRAFIFIYLVFIMLLIMNVIGCSRIDLSGLS